MFTYSRYLGFLAMPVNPLLSKTFKMLPKPARRVLNNANDRIFRARHLVLAGQTPFEVLHDNGLVKLRHYLPLTGDSIMVDGNAMPVNQTKHRVPFFFC